MFFSVIQCSVHFRHSVRLRHDCSYLHVRAGKGYQYLIFSRSVELRITFELQLGGLRYLLNRDMDFATPERDRGRDIAHSRQQPWPEADEIFPGLQPDDMMNKQNQNFTPGPG